MVWEENAPNRKGSFKNVFAILISLEIKRLLHGRRD
jgi:hypothetical protein